MWNVLRVRNWIRTRSSCHSFGLGSPGGPDLRCFLWLFCLQLLLVKHPAQLIHYDPPQFPAHISFPLDNLVLWEYPLDQYPPTAPAMDGNRFRHVSSASPITLSRDLGSVKKWWRPSPSLRVSPSKVSPLSKGQFSVSPTRWPQLRCTETLTGSF